MEGSWEGGGGGCFSVPAAGVMFGGGVRKRTIQSCQGATNAGLTSEIFDNTITLGGLISQAL